MKSEFSRAVPVSELLYNCTTLILPKRLEKKLNENYKRMLLTTLNKSKK